MPEGVRLQKVLAASGVGSRRRCEELIAAGRVEVDGDVVTELGRRVDPARAVIRVDGARVDSRPDATYLALNKPRGMVSTMSDPEGRPSLADVIRSSGPRLFHVGRLDSDSEGLLLITNDGELAHRLTHARYGVPKTYLADVPGPVPRDLGRQLRAGVPLEDGLVVGDRFRVLESAAGRALVEVVLHEGRKHVVRRLLAEVGHPVRRLVRTAVGPIRLGDLGAGRVRRLTSVEVAELYRAVGL